MILEKKAEHKQINIESLVVITDYMRFSFCIFFFSLLISLGNNLSNLASSAENFKSLTRIFPHLGKDLSNSLPTNFDQSTSNTSPNEYTMDLFHSDFSTSSATSSFSRSGIGMPKLII